MQYPVDHVCMCGTQPLSTNEELLSLQAFPFMVTAMVQNRRGLLLLKTALGFSQNSSETFPGERRFVVTKRVSLCASSICKVLSCDFLASYDYVEQNGHGNQHALILASILVRDHFFSWCFCPSFILKQVEMVVQTMHSFPRKTNKEKRQLMPKWLLEINAFFVSRIYLFSCTFISHVHLVLMPGYTSSMIAPI